MHEISGRKRPTVRRAVLAALSTIAVVAAAAAGVVLPANAAAPPAPADWSRVFLDDFDGPAGSGVSTADWQYTTGTSYPGGPARFGTGEIEAMTADPSNVSLDGTGNLRITPRRDAAGNWTSGRVETRRADFQPPAGGKLRSEARIQMPNVTGPAAKGYWPAFWMLGAPYRGNWWNWPGIGEIDILENVQGLNNVWATVHCGTSPGGPCNETSGIGGQRVCPGASCQAGFHTYAVEWDRSTAVEEMRFYVDEFNFHTVRADQVDAKTWTDATNHGYFIIPSPTTASRARPRRAPPTAAAARTSRRSATATGHCSAASTSAPPRPGSSTGAWPAVRPAGSAGWSRCGSTTRPRLRSAASRSRPPAAGRAGARCRRTSRRSRARTTST